MGGGAQLAAVSWLRGLLLGSPEMLCDFSWGLRGWARPSLSLGTRGEMVSFRWRDQLSSHMVWESDGTYRCLVVFAWFFFFGKPKSKASLPPGVYISYCTVWEGHDLTRCRRFPRINPSSPYPFCNLLRILYTHARRHGHTGTHTHTDGRARRKRAPRSPAAPRRRCDWMVFSWRGDVSSRSHDFSSVWNHL